MCMCACVRGVWSLKNYEHIYILNICATVERERELEHFANKKEENRLKIK